ncbi:glycoside hydrolase, partial [Methanoculleus bourgensis]
PYHDWNERVAAECYAPNTAARILDAEGVIVEVVNTYSRISFTAAPTLLSWLERHRPGVHKAVIDADLESRERYAGHGSAIASCYNHLIMPLATHEDKRTQIAWGVRDFAARFGREPEGMWLPETAVDIESLDLMAKAGIRFTILAPHQAGKVRAIGTDGWTDVSGGRVETRMPYLCRLPSGRSIAVFFYNGAIARDVAFGDLLSDGRRFAGRLLGAFSRGGKRPELVHVATDGETYGHHRKFGEMALAYCLRTIEARDDARLTVYGEYLAAHPPTHEVVIQERTSWSCTHGVERWRRECGC